MSAGVASTVKQIDRLTSHFRALIEASPFAGLATCGPEGLDCSPREDRPGFVRIADEHTLMLPRPARQQPGGLASQHRPRPARRPAVPDPWERTTLRVNARAHLSVEPQLLARFAVDGKPPRSVMVMRVETLFFQCARAVVRSHLGDPAHHVDPATLPSPGVILADLSAGTVGGEPYDREWPERAETTMW